MYLSSASKASCLCNGNRIALKCNFSTTTVLLSCKRQKTQDTDIFCPWAQGPSDWLPALSFRVLVLTCQRFLPWAPFFFFTQGPSSAAIFPNHHLYLVLLLLLLPRASWQESHALLCQSPPCYADFLVRLYLELPGVGSQKLGCAAKRTWLPWVFLSCGVLPGMWSYVLPHLKAMSLFQIEKKCGSIKLTFVKERPCMWLGSFFYFRKPILQVWTWNWPISNSWNLSKCQSLDRHRPTGKEVRCSWKWGPSSAIWTHTWVGPTRGSASSHLWF